MRQNKLARTNLGIYIKTEPLPRSHIKDEVITKMDQNINRPYINSNFSFIFKMQVFCRTMLTKTKEQLREVNDDGETFKLYEDCFLIE